MQRLTQTLLNDLPESIFRAGYSRTELQAGIVHLGLGAFHRAHQAIYTEDAVNSAGGDWGIIGVSLRSDTLAKQLLPQDCLYSVISQDAEQQEVRIVGILKDVLVAPKELQRVIAAIANPNTKIITLTITEKGYCLASDGHSLARNNPDIAADLKNPMKPRSAVGVLALGLQKRMSSAAGPITLLSCDNLSENSRLLKGVLLEYSQQCFSELLPYLQTSVSFPCSMVDRIVPAPTADDHSVAYEDSRWIDQGVVTTERFSQWVIEDDFAAGRPCWHEVGVQLISDVRPFEQLKLQLLNASHTAIAVCGQLLELKTVADVMHDKECAQLIADLLDNVLLPSVHIPPGFNAQLYRDSLLLRFRNPHLNHHCRQIAMDSSEKISQRWLPALQNAAPSPKLVRLLSAWCYLVLCTEIVISDPQQSTLNTLRHSGDQLTNRVANVLNTARIQADTVLSFEELCEQICHDIAHIRNSSLRVFLTSDLND